MAWTYGADPSGSPRDEVRLLVGDTDATDQLLSDEEIDFILTVESGTSPRYAAAAACAEAIAASCAKKMDRSIGGLSVSWSMRYQQYREMATTLRKTATSARYTAAAPELVGGGEKVLGPTPDPVSYNPEL